MQCGFWTARKSNTKFFNMNAMNLSTGFTQQRNRRAVEQSFKTLVAQGKSKQYYVLVLPIAEEVDLKKPQKRWGRNPSR